MARPPKEIDMQKLESLMRFRPDKEDIAAFFQVSPDTIERRIKEWCGLTFKELRQEQMAHTKLGLIQEALLRAKKSDTMLIFCLKNIADWADKPDIAIQNNVSTDVKVTSEKIEVLERIRQLKEKNGKA